MAATHVILGVKISRAILLRSYNGRTNGPDLSEISTFGLAFRDKALMSADISSKFCVWPAPLTPSSSAFTFFVGKNTRWYGFNFVISEESASNRSGLDKEEIDQFLQAISPRRVIHRFVIGDHFLDTQVVPYLFAVSI